MKNLEMVYPLKRMDKLIVLRATGTPKEFATKINLSESRLYDLIKEMKEIGVPIHYSRIQRTYLYKKNGQFSIVLEWVEHIN